MYVPFAQARWPSQPWRVPMDVPGAGWRPWKANPQLGQDYFHLRDCARDLWQWCQLRHKQGAHSDTPTQQSGTARVSSASILNRTELHKICLLRILPEGYDQVTSFFIFQQIEGPHRWVWSEQWFRGVTKGNKHWFFKWIHQKPFIG